MRRVRSHVAPRASWVQGAAACWLAFCVGGLSTAAEPVPAKVVVVAVEQREIARGETFVGTVVPLRRTTVGSTVEGRVVEFGVREGDRVNKDQVLVRLRTRQLELQLAAAQAELELRRQELAQLEHGLRPEEIQQANAKMLGAKALMDFARLRLQRMRSLVERNAATQDELQENISATEAASQHHAETKAAWELAVAGPRKEQVAQAQARKVAAEELVRRLEDEIAEHTIRAPLAGYITKEHTQVGQWIARGGPVVELVEVDTVEVEVPVLESVAPLLRPGTSARVEIPALPQTVWSGPITRIVPQADLRSRSFPVRVQLANRMGPNGMMLKPGMFARVTLPVGSKEPALLVPKDALVLGESAATVWVLQADGNPGVQGRGTVRPVPVELGGGEEDWIAVRGALKPGERVVTSGNERLVPGQSVIVVQPDKALSRSK